jgi:hypothetical protein
METIPLRPVFENKLFQDSKPIVKYAVLNAVYLLCIERKTEEPIPKYLEPYLGLCNPSYYRNKDVCRIILTDVLPKIAKIKYLKRKQVINGHKAQSMVAIKSRLKSMENNTFSDKIDTHEKFTLTPTPPKPYNSGAFDPIAVQKAKDNNATGKKRVFYDKPKD